MRVVLFDLGDTLEHEGALLTGARETLSALATMRDDKGRAPVVALVSDYYPADTPAQVDAYRKRYYKVLSDLGIDQFFTPLPAHVTLSTEVGVEKPNQKIFRAALDKIQPQLPFTHAVFITENDSHVEAARKLGMAAIRVAGPTESGAPRLDELLPQLERLLTFSPCGRKTAVRVTSETAKNKQADPRRRELRLSHDLRHTGQDRFLFSERTSENDFGYDLKGVSLVTPSCQQRYHCDEQS
jgi:beta-phosphoglucomutase-like phosphatase (HAD superfamily)